MRKDLRSRNTKELGQGQQSPIGQRVEENIVAATLQSHRFSNRPCKLTFVWPQLLGGVSKIATQRGQTRNHVVHHEDLHRFPSTFYYR